MVIKVYSKYNNTSKAPNKALMELVIIELNK